ncbi:MAG TPA: hypothetical protein VFG89_00195 [Coriobacteriia bacterium]|nr:hypothetical protein [Coriobacteriia bacterium]
MKRTFLIGTIVVLFLFAGVSSAFAWANGADTDGDGWGDNGYGSHDWILDQAIQLAGANASWIQTETARFATDDPDTVLRDVNNHFYDNTRKGQGAPQMVSDLYDRIANEYATGNYADASRDIGLLSHYYADINQPFHTLWYGDDDDEHVDYELVVNSLTNSPGENADWIVPRERRPVADIRAMTISAAFAARSDYYALRNAYVPSDEAVPVGNFDGSAAAPTGAITRARVSRAVNDLADIISAAPSGQGRTPHVTVSSVRLSRRYVGTNSAITATARVTDAYGAPVRGVRVTFTSNFSSGPIDTFDYSDSDGAVSLSQSLPNEALWYVVNVKAATKTNGVVSSANNWMITTPKVGAMSTAFSSKKPKQKTKVYAATRLTDKDGVPIANVPVKVTWRFKSKSYYYTVSTDANGYAVTSRNIGKATAGYKVRVTATTECGGETKSKVAYFTPQKPKKKK